MCHVTVGIEKAGRTGDLCVIFKENNEGLIIPSFKGVMRKLCENRKAGRLQVPCVMRGRSLDMNDCCRRHV